MSLLVGYLVYLSVAVGIVVIAARLYSDELYDDADARLFVVVVALLWPVSVFAAVLWWLVRKLTR